MKNITIEGAKTHNLKNVSLKIPREKLTVITGLSGSGKSSLAFDTLYAEGQRRYVESLSTYARQFLSLMERPEVDYIEGLSPSVAIEQKSPNHNPRSTVGTTTEIYDYLRLLFARVGEPHCPIHGTKLESQTISQMLDRILELEDESRVNLLAPLVRNRRGEYQKLLENLSREGFIRIRVDGKTYEIDEAPNLDKNSKHSIDAVVDRFRIRPKIRTRLSESIETALRLSGGLVLIELDGKRQEDMVFSAKFSCNSCGYSLPELEPRIFSFNNPAGACRVCDGLGTKEYFDPEAILVDPHLSIAEGAIKGWDRSNEYYFQMLQSLGDHFDIDLSKPFKDLPEKFKERILWGYKESQVSFVHYKNGERYIVKQTFEGIIPNIERRYKETESDLVRQKLSKFLSMKECHECKGSRLNKDGTSVKLSGKNISSYTNMTIVEAKNELNQLVFRGKNQTIAEKILREIKARLGFLDDVGLGYLTLSRKSNSLSGGESQRIRLASQIGGGLVGVMYVLDEPTIGLHAKDNQKLINTLLKLRDLGNTVIVVEHDLDTMRAADCIVDVGPLAGQEGGEIIAVGSIDDLVSAKRSITGKFLSGEVRIPIPKRRAINKDKTINLKNVSENNLKNISVEIPIGLMTCVTGVSGSGKSTLINQTLYPIAAKLLNRAGNRTYNQDVDHEGLQFFEKVVAIDQSPIGRTPRSNPATYTNIFGYIRELFANTKEARLRGYKAGRFSFNLQGGRCESCQGEGLVKVNMHFLSDIFVKCDECDGSRYNKETLEILYKGKNIHQVLDMTVAEAQSFLSAVPNAKRILKTLVEVGLEYIKLGQSSVTLSGGESQRVKLARELAKKESGKTLYIFDEPSTGLHFYDVKKLIEVFQKLLERENTLVVIEHNLEIIKSCDWVIDLGPEGGDNGGKIVGQGTPEQLSQIDQSYTGIALKELFSK
ncbi:excinuclease ABC subunit UvrA [Gammaproteobacteria bacterium]|nr:excinuclease ABC subunit UvrA [Gammaproteobacteria bacterium]